MRTRSSPSIWAPKPQKSVLESKRNTRPCKKKTEAGIRVGPAAFQPSKTTSQPSDLPQGSEPEFSLFPKLPPEIRQLIWKLNIPNPRVVKITHDPKDMRIVELDEIKSGLNPWWRAKAYAGPVPALLHVNIEARSLLLRYYSLSFSEQTQGRPIYFDPTRDTLCLPSKEAIRAFYGRRMNGGAKQREKDLEHMHETEHAVRLLAIASNLLDCSYPVSRILPRYSNLESVTLIWPQFWLSYAWYNARLTSSEDLAVEKWNEAGFKVPRIDYMNPEMFTRQFIQA